VALDSDRLLDTLDLRLTTYYVGGALKVRTYGDETFILGRTRRRVTSSKSAVLSWMLFRCFFEGTVTITKETVIKERSDHGPHTISSTSASRYGIIAKLHSHSTY